MKRQVVETANAWQFMEASVVVFKNAAVLMVSFLLCSALLLLSLHLNPTHTVKCTRAPSFPFLTNRSVNWARWFLSLASASSSRKRDGGTGKTSIRSLRLLHRPAQLQQWWLGRYSIRYLRSQSMHTSLYALLFISVVWFYTCLGTRLSWYTYCMRIDIYVFVCKCVRVSDYGGLGFYFVCLLWF